MSDRSDELHVGTERGMVRTLRRREATERVAFAFLNAVSARPWNGAKSAKDVRVVVPDGSSPAVMAEAEAIGKTRRLHINQADMKKHGFTDGCLGCRCFAAGKRAQGHFEGCRARLEAAITKSDDGRVRLTTAFLRFLARDEERGPAESATSDSSSTDPGRSSGRATVRWRRSANGSH